MREAEIVGNKINNLDNEFKNKYNMNNMISNYKNQATSNFNNSYQFNPSEAVKLGMNQEQYKALQLSKTLSNASNQATNDYNIQADHLYNQTAKLADDFNKKQSMQNIANYKEKYGEEYYQRPSAIPLVASGGSGISRNSGKENYPELERVGALNPDGSINFNKLNQLNGLSGGGTNAPAQQMTQVQRPQAPQFNINAMNNQINSMYQSQLNADRERLKRAQEEKQLSLNQRRGDVDLNYNQGMNRINNSITDTKQNYQEARNSEGAVNNQNVLKLREAMSSMGLGNSGTNLQNMTNLQNQHMGNLNSLNKQENQTLDDLNLQGNEMSAQRAKSLTDIDEQIDQLKRSGISEESEIMQRLEAQKAGQLLEMMKYGDERALQLYGMQTSQYNADRAFDYQKSRDDVGDKRYDSEWQHRLDREGIEDNRWDKEWNHRIDREGIEDTRWDKTWDREGAWHKEDTDFRDKDWNRNGTWHEQDNAFRDKEFNANQAYRNSQLALARARASRSGGSGRSGRSGKKKGSKDNTNYSNTIYKNSNQKGIFNYSMSKKDSYATKVQQLDGYMHDRYATKADRDFAALQKHALEAARWYEGR